ncbi:DUF4931 domain-containing protein [Candidatus Parcubacteria bacterium]|nr:DUF4931 domain-containing protein [Patescibacteria group bacterium]MCG2693787.1 DUF4931 domain-containing protein [Candidatus Parcubacteria bacterium]
MQLKNNTKIYKDFWELSSKERTKRKIIKSEIRKDYLDDRLVVFAPNRKWKIKTSGSREPASQNKEENCRLCPENIDKESFSLKVPEDGSAWEIKVVGNKFSTFSQTNKNARGIQEIVIETPRHGEGLEEMPLDKIQKIIEVYIERTKKLSKEKRVNYIEIFKNHGEHAGASIQHEHSQIFATEIIPLRILERLKKEKEYPGCIYCDIIKKEKKGPRKIFEDKNFLVLCPYASERSYEVMVLPKRHLDNISKLNAEEKKSLAKIFKSVLRGVKNLGLSYNFYFHEVVRVSDQHVYLKIQPRSNVWAGLELGAGLIINSVPPEESADYYKKYFKR